MTQIEKLKRWADKVGWFVVRESKDAEGIVRWVGFLLPDGTQVGIDCDPNGEIDYIGISKE